MNTVSIRWQIIILFSITAIFSLEAKCSKLTAEDVIKLKEAGISEETIRKMIENEQEATTGTLVFGQIDNRSFSWSDAGDFETYARGKGRLCKFDGIDFPEGYSGKGYDCVFPYGCCDEDRNYARCGVNLFVVEIEAGRHIFLFPDKDGNYGAAHLGGASEGISVESFSSQNATFMLKPGEIVFYRYEDKRLDRVNSIEEIVDNFTPNSAVNKLVGLRNIVGYDLPGAIIKDHKAKYKSYEPPKSETSLVVLRTTFACGEDKNWARRPGTVAFYAEGSDKCIDTIRYWPTYWEYDSNAEATKLKHGRYYMKLDKYDWRFAGHTRFFDQQDGIIHFNVLPDKVTVIEMPPLELAKVFYEDWSTAIPRSKTSLIMSIKTYLERIRTSNYNWGASVALVDAGGNQWEISGIGTTSTVKKQKVQESRLEFDKVTPGVATVSMSLWTRTDLGWFKAHEFDRYWEHNCTVDIKVGAITKLNFIAQDNAVQMSIEQSK